MIEPATPRLLQALQQIIPADRIKDSLSDRLSYASDAGFYQLIPQVVVQPASVTEVQHLMRLSRQLQIPLVFRAGGTSLSGQCITDGILVDIGQHWRGIKVQAETVTVQPGITGGMVNHYLKKHQRKIGPDPASIHAAMMGGIISNNASGMCCGVAHNSYHTVQHLHMVLPDGQAYHTAHDNEYVRFENEQPAICTELLRMRRQLMANDTLYNRIRHKYRTKNTVGYSLNALLDYQHPLDMLAHLMVGAEGTLGFIAEATLLTLPDKPHKAAAMLYFASIGEACSSIAVLNESGVEALELMDYASLQSVRHLPGLPDFFQQLPAGTAALLCEYQTTSAEALQIKLQEVAPLMAKLPLLHEAMFETEEKRRMLYWKMRKGMFPSVGAVRQRGSTVILEDVAVPVPRLADAVAGLQLLFEKYGYHQAIIFGHARDGNIHFVITQMLDTPEEIDRYDRFLKEVVKLIVEVYDGALKAEHGTGRNMAPFVEAEWGGELYAMMQQIKQVVDPLGWLNPGVIINNDANAHIQHLKDLPQVEEEVDKCIECGFCEPSCPSRDLTMTPRRRIVARRALQRLQQAGETKLAAELLQQYQHDGLETCATDGLCATDCPVDINTGELVKRLRREQHGAMGKRIAMGMARHFSWVERGTRTAVRIAAGLDGFISPGWLSRLSKRLHNWWPAIPQWLHAMKGVGQWRTPKVSMPHAIYYSSCINRTMQSGHVSLQQTMYALCQRAGIGLHMPGNIVGTCCGQPFSSKGYPDAAQLLHQQLIDHMWVWSNQGQWPIVIDFTSCTYNMMSNLKHLSKEYQHKQSQLRIVDSLQYLYEEVLPKLNITQKADKVAIHPTCATTKLNLAESLQALAAAGAHEVVKPAYAGCCGMAGDRGMLVPALPKQATAPELAELEGMNLFGRYASASTCQMALEENGGNQYDHIATLLLAVTEPLAEGAKK